MNTCVWMNAERALEQMVKLHAYIDIKARIKDKSLDLKAAHRGIVFLI